MKDIIIKTVPASKIRNGGVGDYYETDNSIHILVAEQTNPDYEVLIGFHELIEFILTRKRGISEQDIDTYDRFWELRNKQGLVNCPEPGEDASNTIYRTEHSIAIDLERILCRELGYNFEDYNKQLIN